MINLIPPDAKGAIRREYIVRVSSVWIALVGCALLGASFLLLPTYLFYSNQIRASVREAASSEERLEAYERMRASLSEAQTFAKRLSLSIESVRASDILAHIEDALTEAIALEGLQIVQEEKGTRIEVRGKARTRDALRVFLRRIESDTYFLDAQVPVSDLAKDTNLLFTMTVRLNHTP